MSKCERKILGKLLLKHSLCPTDGANKRKNNHDIRQVCKPNATSSRELKYHINTNDIENTSEFQLYANGIQLH